MNALCPDCNTELTPSIMGYLCHGCGAVHRFAKVGTVQPGINQFSSNSTRTNQNSSQPPKKENSAKSPSKLTHTVKKFVVPNIAELPKPVDENHLLSDHYDDAPVAQTNSLLGTTPPLAAAVAQNEAAIERSNTSFAQYIQKENRDSGQTRPVIRNFDRLSLILGITVLLACIIFVATLVFGQLRF